VRDALRMLEAHGLIEVKVGAGGGAFVTAPEPKLLGEGIGDMLMLADVTPANVTEARMVFELGMLELACERAQDDDLAELDEICARAEAALAAGAYEASLSAEFHLQLARCTHNGAIGLLAETFQGPLETSLKEARRADPETGKTGALEHRAIVDAIRARDPGAARAIMAAHLNRTAERVRTKRPTA
jgi:DNA-binding FadR family transcriptional regulator